MSVAPPKSVSGDGEAEFRPCALCAKPATMLCARCLAVAFCNETCQRGAWRDHKPLCKPALVATAATAMVLAKSKKAPAPAELPNA